MVSNAQASRALGWASMAIGLVEVAATGWVERELGVDDHDTLIRALGFREMAAGVTILSQSGPNAVVAGGLWARVAGDAMDLALLAAAGESTFNRSGWMTLTGMVLAITGLDVLVACRVQADLNRAAAAGRQYRLPKDPAAASGMAAATVVGTAAAAG